MSITPASNRPPRRLITFLHVFVGLVLFFVMKPYFDAANEQAADLMTYLPFLCGMFCGTASTVFLLLLLLQLGDDLPTPPPQP